MSWFSAVPQSLFIFIDVCAFLGGVGLILPAITRVKPKLTPFAAIGLTPIMILTAGLEALSHSSRTWALCTRLSRGVGW